MRVKIKQQLYSKKNIRKKRNDLTVSALFKAHAGKVGNINRQRQTNRQTSDES